MYGFGISERFLFIIVIPLWLLIRFVYILIKKGKGVQIKVIREIIYNIFVIYLIALIGFTLFPITIRFGERFVYYQDYINYIPIVSLIKIRALGILLRNLGGNIVLFMPLGFFLPILWNKYRSLKHCMLIAISMSFVIEILQYLENLFVLSDRRVCDIDDIILNSIGALIGFMAYKGLRKVYNLLIKKQEIL
jgi:glycopeptide antibiotics resistance protein